jgi:hypothetical protein
VYLDPSQPTRIGWKLDDCSPQISELEAEKDLCRSQLALLSNIAGLAGELSIMTA